MQEVLHATFEHHAYPMHTHDSWTVLMIDEGNVVFGMDGHDHDATPTRVSLLPPHVPHDGRAALQGTSFRKRVLYLDPGWLPERFASLAARSPLLLDPDAARTVQRAHLAFREPSDLLEAEHEVYLLHELARAQFSPLAAVPLRDSPIARRLRALLDDRLRETFTIAEAAQLLGSHPNHLIRAFSQAYGMPPHRYVTGRRIDLARRLLLTGASPAEAATDAGFHDQSHLTRHFRKVLGSTPAAFARGCER